VECGDEWHAVWEPPEDVTEKGKILRELCTKTGKNFAEFPLTINVNNRVPYTIENVKKYEAAGISMMFIPRSFQADANALMENMEKFAKEIKEPLEKQRSLPRRESLGVLLCQEMHVFPAMIRPRFDHNLSRTEESLGNVQASETPLPL
jgi:hypothetical protein